MRRRLVLGTAGHIDHGKTALVRALTGTDTDRLPEEKRRGISIDLGFAHLPLTPELDFAVVDVPGHESLVRNMLAGATGIDIVLLVIAADEGVMPQTREHLAIMELLEVERAVVALTKVDRVEAEWLELVADDVAAGLDATRYAGAPVLPVSAVTGQGLEALRTALAQAAAEVPERSRDDLLRLPLDRVFSVHGTGTVATGTIWSGAVRAEGMLRALPEGGRVRVRGLQSHGAEVASAGAGERVALALAVDRERLGRGTTLLDSDAWTAAALLTLHVRVLGEARAPLRRRQRVRFHLGTAEVLGRIVPVEAEEIAPGEAAWAQLRLEAPVVARAGDRFVIRHYSPVHTIAGGIVVEPDARRRKRLNAEVAQDLARVRDGDEAAPAAAIRLAGPAGLAAARLPIVSGIASARIREDRLDAVRAGERVFAAELASAARAALRAAVNRTHADRPIDPGIEREELRRAAAPADPALVDGVLRELLEQGVLVTRGTAIAAPGFAPRLAPDQQAAAAQLLELFATAALAAPRVPELPEPLRSRPDLPGVLRLLEAEGRLVALAHDHFADAATILRAISDLRAQFEPGQALTTSDLKQVLTVSRKYLIPLLEYFDRSGVTRRVGEERVLLRGQG